MQVLRYEDSLADLVDYEEPTIFLAGPTVRGNQPHLTSWRFAAIEEFERQGFTGTLILPEFTSRTESDKGKLWIPRWEYAGLSGCDCIMFWVPRTKELIGLTTNHEHGYWLAKRRAKCVYGRPEDSYRNTYLDIMWEVEYLSDPDMELLGIRQICQTLPETVERSIRVAKNAIRHYRVKSRIPVASPYGWF